MEQETVLGIKYSRAHVVAVQSEESNVKHIQQWLLPLAFHI